MLIAHILLETYIEDCANTNIKIEIMCPAHIHKREK